MIYKIRQLFLSKLALASSWLFAGGIIGGLLGYMFQIFMGRMLSVAEYGLFTALMSLLMMFGSPLSTLFMLVSRRVAGFRSSEYSAYLSYLFYKIYKNIFVFQIIFTILSITFIFNPLINYLSIEKDVHLYLLLIIFLISIPQAVNNAYLQGMQYFKWFSASSIIAILLKIIIAVILIYAGYKVSGALIAMIIASLIVLFLTYMVLRPSLKIAGKRNDDKAWFSLRYIAPVLLANFAFSIMTFIDVLVVRYYFSEQDAGIYAAAAVLGKAIMYLPSGIALALFPMVAENYNSNKSSSHLLIQAGILTVLLCMIGAVSYYFLGDLIIVFLYTETYGQASEILKYYGFAMVPMALILVAENFLIAMNKVLFAYLLMIVAPLQLIAMYYWHDSLLSIVYINFIAGMALVLIGYPIIWKGFRRQPLSK